MLAEQPQVLFHVSRSLTHCMSFRMASLHTVCSARLQICDSTQEAVALSQTEADVSYTVHSTPTTRSSWSLSTTNQQRPGGNSPPFSSSIWQIWGIKCMHFQSWMSQFSVQSLLSPKHYTYIGVQLRVGTCPSSGSSAPFPNTNLTFLKSVGKNNVWSVCVDVPIIV